MSQVVRYRTVRGSEPFEGYLPFLAWPVFFLFSYGSWMWAFVFVPLVAVRALAYLWRAGKPTIASAVRSGAGVAFIDERGQRVDGFDDSEVDAVTTLFDPGRKTVALRVDRKGKRGLVFETNGPADLPDVARALGVDLDRSRSRFEAGSMLQKPLGMIFIFGMMTIAYTALAQPTGDAKYFLDTFDRFVFLPSIVLIGIPTIVDLGRDGVAWRWLFVHRYAGFASTLLMTPRPPRAVGPKVVSLRITMTNRRDLELPLGARAGFASAHVLQAFAAAKDQAAKPLESDVAWLARNRESTVAWLQRLRAKSVTAGTYRGSDHAHLWPLAENPTTARDVRCATALVLATSDDARIRIRALVGQTTDPAVRAVFEAIADRTNDEQLALLIDRATPVS